MPAIIHIPLCCCPGLRSAPFLPRQTHHRAPLYPAGICPASAPLRLAFSLPYHANVASKRDGANDIFYTISAKCRQWVINDRSLYSGLKDKRGYRSSGQAIRDILFIVAVNERPAFAI